MELSNIISLINSRFSERDRKRLEQIIIDYTEGLKKRFLEQENELTRNMLLSEYNFETRAELKSCKCFNMVIREGDIVYIDYGKAYQLETGYQHFGIIVRVYNAKALVIPMTSNAEAYNDAYDPRSNPEGLTHLMRIGRQRGCYKYSVLFLNDAKFINTARIINIKAHISTESELYKKIMARLIEIIQLGI